MLDELIVFSMKGKCIFIILWPANKFVQFLYMLKTGQVIGVPTLSIFDKGLSENCWLLIWCNLNEFSTTWIKEGFLLFFIKLIHSNWENLTKFIMSWYSLYGKFMTFLNLSLFSLFPQFSAANLFWWLGRTWMMSTVHIERAYCVFTLVLWVHIVREKTVRVFIFVIEKFVSIFHGCVNCKMKGSR